MPLLQLLHRSLWFPKCRIRNYFHLHRSFHPSHFLMVHYKIYRFELVEFCPPLCFVWYLLSCYKQSSSKPLPAAMFLFWRSSYIYPQWLNYQHMMVKWILIQFTFYCCQIKHFFTRVNVYYILFWCRNHSILVFIKGACFGDSFGGYFCHIPSKVYCWTFSTSYIFLPDLFKL